MDVGGVLRFPLRFRRANASPSVDYRAEITRSSVVGVNLAYDDRGSGDPVLFIAGRGGRRPHLAPAPGAGVPARRVTASSRSTTAASARPRTPTGSQPRRMVADTAALIEKLDIGPVRIVAVSMGAFIAQELMMARPELVSAGGADGHPRPRWTGPASSSAPPSSNSPNPASGFRPHMTRKCACWKVFHQRHSTTTLPSRDWIDMFTMWPTKTDAGPQTAAGSIAPAGQPAARLPKYYGPDAGDRLRRRRGAAAAPRPRGRRRHPERPVPADSRHRAPRLHREAAGGQRRGAEFLRR